MPEPPIRFSSIRPDEKLLPDISRTAPFRFLRWDTYWAILSPLPSIGRSNAGTEALPRNSAFPPCSEQIEDDGKAVHSSKPGALDRFEFRVDCLKFTVEFGTTGVIADRLLNRQLQGVDSR